LADEAHDLKALKSSVVEAATVSGTLWVSYLFVLFYLAVAAGAVSHKDMFFERGVKLPFLGIDLPLTAFFAMGPALFLIVHAYVLVISSRAGNANLRFREPFGRPHEPAPANAK
jgi:hypothetical protein